MFSPPCRHTVWEWCWNIFCKVLWHNLSFRRRAWSTSTSICRIEPSADSAVQTVNCRRSSVSGHSSTVLEQPSWQCHVGQFGQFVVSFTASTETHSVPTVISRHYPVTFLNTHSSPSSGIATTTLATAKKSLIDWYLYSSAGTEQRRLTQACGCLFISIQIMQITEVQQGRSSLVVSLTENVKLLQRTLIVVNWNNMPHGRLPLLCYSLPNRHYTRNMQKLSRCSSHNGQFLSVHC